MIVDGGKFKGIVDVDDLCFGDIRSTLSLTKMAILGSSVDPDYVDLWSAELGLTDRDPRIIDFYAMVCCVTFMGELGQTSNGNMVADPDDKMICYQRIFERLRDSYA